MGQSCIIVICGYTVYSSCHELLVAAKYSWDGRSPHHSKGTVFLFSQINVATGFLCIYCTVNEIVFKTRESYFFGVFFLFLFFFTQGSSHLPVVFSSWNEQAHRENCLILSTSFFLSLSLYEGEGILYLSNKGCRAFSCCHTLGHQPLKARMRYNCINVWKQCGYWVQVNIIIQRMNYILT